MDEHYKLCIKSNVVLTDDPCAICGKDCNPGGLDLFLDGTPHLVCHDCGEKYAPDLRVLLAYAYEAWAAYAMERRFVKV